MENQNALYDRAAGMLKVHGILSIVFGGLGVLMALFFISIMFITSTAYESFNRFDGSSLGIFLVSIIFFVFWTLPHIYLIVSGLYLTRQPSPRIAKTLVIINLIIGVFWNYVLLVFAIINLTQIADYQKGRHVSHKHTKKD